MIGFYHGTSLPEQTKMGIYFIVSEGKGKLYRVLSDGAEAVLVAETNNDTEFNQLKAAVEKAQQDIQSNATSVGQALASIKKITDVHGETLQNITTEAASIRTLAQGAADQAATNKTDLKNLKDRVDGHDQAFLAIKDHATVDSFADVMTEMAKYQIAGDYATNTEVTTKVGAVDKKVKDLTDYVGTFSTEGIPAEENVQTVIDYIDFKTEEVLSDNSISELRTRIGQAEEAIEVIEGDYLKAADKAELAKAIADEATTARAAEKANADAIKAIQDDYLVEADKTELQGNIDTVSGKVATLIGEDTGKSVRAIANDELAKQLIPETAQESLDTLQEIAAWIQSHPGDAAAMNKAIEDLATFVGEIPEDATAETIVAYIAELVKAEEDRAKLAEEAILEKAEQGISDAATAQAAAEAAQGEVDALEGVVATKAAQADLTALSGVVDTKATTAALTELAGVVDTKATITALNGVDGRVATIESDLNTDETGLKARMAAAEGEIDVLQSDLNTAETGIKARLAAVEKKASDNATAIASNDQDIAAIMAMLSWQQA